MTMRSPYDSMGRSALFRSHSGATTEPSDRHRMAIGSSCDLTFRCVTWTSSSLRVASSRDSARDRYTLEPSVTVARGFQKESTKHWYESYRIIKWFWGDQMWSVIHRLSCNNNSERSMTKNHQRKSTMIDSDPICFVKGSSLHAETPQKHLPCQSSRSWHHWCGSVGMTSVTVLVLITR